MLKPVTSKSISQLRQEVAACRRCPRLVAWREEVAARKVKRFAQESYWGRAVPGFGDPSARLLLVGLAPAAHGANRTGRMFTGDRSGEWLYRSLHKFGFANQPDSVLVDDGLELSACYVTAAVRCAPPQNKPNAGEKANCFPYLLRELELLHELEVVVALGRIAFETTVKAFRQAGLAASGTKPVFGHGREVTFGDGITLIASYHPSQQNTFTGRLTEPMFDAIFARTRSLLSGEANEGKA